MTQKSFHGNAGGAASRPGTGERALICQYGDYRIDLRIERDGDGSLFVTGRATRVASGEPVPGVELGSGDAKRTSGADGRFAVALPASAPPLQFRIRAADLDVVGNIPLFAGPSAG